MFHVKKFMRSIQLTFSSPLVSLSNSRVAHSQDQRLAHAKRGTRHIAEAGEGSEQKLILSDHRYRSSGDPARRFLVRWPILVESAGLKRRLQARPSVHIRNRSEVSTGQ